MGELDDRAHLTVGPSYPFHANARMEQHGTPVRLRWQEVVLCGRRGTLVDPETIMRGDGNAGAMSVYRGHTVSKFVLKVTKPRVGPTSTTHVTVRRKDPTIRDLSYEWSVAGERGVSRPCPRVSAVK